MFPIRFYYTVIADPVAVDFTVGGIAASGS